MSFKGELLENGLVKVFGGQVVTVFGRNSRRDYVCLFSIDLPIKGWVFTTIRRWGKGHNTYLGEVRGVNRLSGARLSGEVHFKVASPDVVGWVPQPGVHPSDHLEFTSSADLAKDPLKKSDEMTVLDRVLGADPFPDPAK